MEITELSKGGLLIKTNKGYVQMGAPSETLKDTLPIIKSVPEIFIVPKHTFSLNQNTSFNDIELPIFFNFFVKGAKTKVVCTPKQQEKTRIILQESFFGPIDFNPAEDFGKTIGPFPIDKEIKALKHHPKENRELMFEDMVEFVSINRNHPGHFENLVFKLHGDTLIIEDGEDSVELPYNIDMPRWEEVIYIGDSFDPPTFGITTLGSSHGFDPKGLTSGFIIWINKRGILVDPPVGSAHWLRERGINPRLISDVILTHCHADHDSGIAEKILDENKIRLYTTKSIFHSYIRKFAAMTGLDENFIKDEINFQRVLIGEPTFIGGAQFIFRSSFHSIPTVGFEVRFRDRKFVYSSDHFYHPESYRNFLEKGIISQERYDYMMDFPWDSDIIFHEAGIPPIHTSVDVLEDLDDSIKSRIYLFHIAENALKEDSMMSRTPLGLENTLVIPVEKSPISELGNILFLLEEIDFIKDFNINQLAQFCFLGLVRKYEAGSYLIREHEEGQAFYIIINGFAEIWRDRRFLKQLTTGDFFGEASILLDQYTKAEVKATSDITTLVISADDFKVFFQGTKLAKHLKHLASVRDTNAWQIIDSSDLFANYTTNFKTQFEYILYPKRIKENEVIHEENTPYKSVALVGDGKLGVFENGNQIGQINTGEMFGKPEYLLNNEPVPFSIVALEPTQLFTIHNNDMKNFLNNFPSFHVRMLFKTDY